MSPRFPLIASLIFLTACPDESKDVLTETAEPDTSADTSPDTANAVDQDQDGFDTDSDCDDLDASTYPGAPEACDGADNDCDGEIDENVTSTWYLDADGDGYGTLGITTEECEAGQGFTDNAEDCNDLDDTIHPAAVEACDGTDNDCDGAVDETDAVDASTWYADNDGDGWGTTENVDTACNAPAGYVLHSGDCDDADPSYHPGAQEADCTDPNDYNCDGSVGYVDADTDGFAACEDCDDNNASTNENGTEVCDGADNDCDGDIDDDATDATTWYGDSDGDGYGGTQFQEEACTAPVNFVATADDCNDLDPASHPGASEVCDAADNDCDSTVDEGVELTFYADADGDGYGDAAQPTEACSQPPGHSSNGDDCDDSTASTSPAAFEICDSIDNDCDTQIDEADAINSSTWYQDADGDGYGDSAQPTEACSQPTGHADNSDDCDDSTTATNPAATETCDTIDNDCDGAIDEADAADASTWYPDLDSDGYGDGSNPQTACSQPPGTLIDGQDCNDTDTNINPAATEVCDAVDNDCDGTTDTNATDASTWYEDADGDGAGADDSTVVACNAPSGYIATGGDCDDSSSANILCADGQTCTADASCTSGYCGPGTGTCIQLTQIVVSGLLTERDGNLGGITGANALCAADAASTGRAGTWVAFLSDTTQDLIDIFPDVQNANGDRLRGSIPVNNIQGNILVSNWDAIGDGSNVSISNAVYALDNDEMDECCGYPNDADAWTGTTVGGTVYSGQHCSDWSTTSGEGVATEIDAMQFLREETGHLCGQTLGVMCVRVEGP